MNPVEAIRGAGRSPGADDRRISLYLFLLVFVTYGSFFGGGGWHQNAVFDVTRAIVERGTIDITAYAGNTGDLAKWGGHIYSNKPPGVSFIAVIPYGLIYLVERAFGVNPDDPIVLILNMWLTTVAVCATSGGLIAAILYRYARQRVGASPLAALAVVLVIAFGTYLFAYSTVLFVHLPNALLLLLAFVLARDKPLIAGACAGAAVACYYASGPAAAIVFFYAGRRNWIRFAAAAAPFIIGLMAYQNVAFGSPFRTSMEMSVPMFVEADRLFGVLGRPDFSVLAEILFGRFRGLFYLSPVLAFAIGGAIVMIRRRVMLPELLTIAAISLSFILINASFNGWHGGAALGPRYILPIVPFLAIPMLFVTGQMRLLWIALAATSIFLNFAATAVNPLPSRRIEDPLGKYIVPLLVTGKLPASTPREPLWGWKVMLGYVSVNRHAPDEDYPFSRHAPGSAPSSWASFNVGEILAPGSRWSLVPIVMWMVGGVALLAYQARGEVERHD
jgi:hypothetical protein